jgi:alanine racemase
MRATRAIIHLSHLRHNIRLIQDHIRRARPKSPPRICVAVKADAYGHGIVQVARVAATEGVHYLAVATVDEAVVLREAQIGSPVLLYSLPIPEELETIVAHDLTPLVADVDFARELSEQARRQERRVSVHLKVDTGMGRIGCRPEDTLELASFVDSTPWLNLEGISTHFPAADTTDHGFTTDQIRRFRTAVDTVRQHGIDPGIVHAANSGATLDYTDSYFDMIRPGILVYGYYPSADQARPLPVLPVMELESQIVFVKRVPPDTPISYGLTHRTTQETCVGTVPVGYGDGYNRLLSNRGRMLVNGRSVPVIGRVCMDQCMVDLGPNPAAARYDRIVAFGPDPAGPDAEEIARSTDTIAYEVTCSVSKRVPRVYLDREEPISEDLATAGIDSTAGRD